MSIDFKGVGQDAGLHRRQYSTLSRNPFHSADNIFLFFAGGERGRILDAIVASIRADMAFAHVYGERGSGKTLLALVLADRLHARYNIIRFDHDGLDVSALLRQLMIELCPQRAAATRLATDTDATTTAHARVVDTQALEAVLEQLATGTPGDRPVLLIIDSAACIDNDVKALLDRLCSVRRDGVRSLQVVLFERIAASASRAHGMNRQPGRNVGDIQNRYWLRRLTLAEISDYLHHHMLLFDFNRRDVFTREMAYFIADRSEGVFRSINAIARNAFLLASLDDEDRPDMSHLLIAGLPPREPPDRHAPFLQRHRRALFATLASLAVVSMLAFVLSVP